MKPFRLISIILMIWAGVAACSDPRQKASSGLKAALDVQIREQIQLLRGLPVDSFPGKPAATDIDKRVSEIILISKDIENLGASVKLGNDFFSDLAAHYRLAAGDFIKLNTGMHIDEIEITLKQNELSFLNMYILRYSSRQAPLTTAH